MSPLAIASDAELVAAVLVGDRRAFQQIVERYQRLLCSLAYSAIGDIAASEDVAQEAFLEAWRRLADLREPAKLRSWLCTIVRFKASRLRRSNRREPVRDAEALDAAAEIPSLEPAAGDTAAQKEELAMMWDALERVPESYREPLILFYREHQSIEHVAVALELSEDTVKQRLSRGRKILQEQVLAAVETALRRTTPGHVFTAGVLALLPKMATPAKAVAIGGAAAKGGVLAKSTAFATMLASLTGVATAVVTLRANLDQSRTPRERRAVVKVTLIFFLSAAAFIVAEYLARGAALRWPAHALALAIGSQALTLIMGISWPLALIVTMRRMRALRSAERRDRPELFRNPIDHVGAAAGEYQSATRWLGIPLVHVRFASPGIDDPPVVAWFAAGDRAYGLIFAWGGCAIAPISIGAISFGLVTLGSFVAGGFAIGTVAIGGIVIGTAAIGVRAAAWVTALGWHTAQSGGFAMARDAAQGPIAFARHANDAVAHQLLADPHADRNQTVLLVAIALASLIPLVWYARSVQQRLGQKRRR